MRKPKERLDDFIVNPATDVAVEPPVEVFVQLTGEVEVLKPLTHQEVPPPTVSESRWNAKYQPLWFRGLLAVGSGALVMIAMVLVSAILVGISEPARGPEVAANEQLGDKPTQTEEPVSFDSFSPSSFASETGALDIVRSKIRRRPARASVTAATYKPRRLRQLPQPEEPKFVPTTLVIYAENGVINTRIEPWLQAVNKRLPTFNN